jgi:hypothetical protein
MQVKIQYANELFGGDCDQAVLVIFRYEDGEWDLAKQVEGKELKELSWDVPGEDDERDWLIRQLTHGVTKPNQSVAEVPLAKANDGVEYFLIAKKPLRKPGILKKVGPDKYIKNPDWRGQE